MVDKKGANGKQRRLRSRDWFDAPGDPTMAALYLERYLNFGLTLAELHSNRPIIGIAQTGSDLSPCNRHHLQLAERVRDGIRDGGGIPIEFPVHPIQETGKRPTAALDRTNIHRVEEVIAETRRATGAAVLWVSHDPEQIARAADRHLQFFGSGLEEAQ